MPHKCWAEAIGSPDWTQPACSRYPTISWVAPQWGHYISTSLGCLVKCLSWFNIYFVFILFANSFVNYYLALLKYTENTKLLSNWFKITEQYSSKWLISYRSILLKILRSNQSICWASVPPTPRLAWGGRPPLVTSSFQQPVGYKNPTG